MVAPDTLGFGAGIGSTQLSRLSDPALDLGDILAAQPFE
jgi:hypothetical protein